MLKVQELIELAIVAKQMPTTLPLCFFLVIVHLKSKQSIARPVYSRGKYRLLNIWSVRRRIAFSNKTGLM